MMESRASIDLHDAERAASLFREGQYDAAGKLYEVLLAAGQDGYGQRVNYAQCLKRAGRWQAAIDQFQNAFRLHRPLSGKGLDSHDCVAIGRRRLRAFYVQHLMEQLEYLTQNKLFAGYSADDRNGLERLGRFLSDCYGANGEGLALPALVEPVADLVGGCANYVSQSDALVRINPAARMQRIELGVEGSPVYVVDDFLDPETLAALQKFLIESTIWYDARPERGYLGAHLHDGLACRLIEKTAQSVLGFAAGLIGPGLISQVWAFKYAPKAAGIDLHADQANWNVNMWLTDEACNRNPESGGMTIYGCRAPENWQFEMYNASPGKVRDFLAASGAASKRIEYRGNRAVVFDSRLFHKTDPVEFSEEYQCRRMNMTVMIDKQE